jgi:ribosomal protein S18 acetylase RimI-like enzyme
VCPLADQSLINELNKRHFRIEMFLNAHFREVLSHEQIPESDPAIEFSHLTEADKELWLKMNLRGFEYDIEWMYDITLAKLYNPHTYCILAKVEGEPAGISALSLHEEIAGMHGTSVLPEFRGRGVQTALINYRLKLAQSLKCELIIVDTTPGNNSQRNVERAGFRTAYTRINMVKPC